MATPPEPAYKGRTLSSWLDDWERTYYIPTNADADAIRAIGTNGLPLLIKWISEEESPLHRKIRFTAEKVIPDRFNPTEPDYYRNLGVAYAINLLGTNAMPAFPILTNLIAKRTHGIRSAIALAGMGSNGIAVLIRSLTNGNVVVRNDAAVGLGSAKSDFDLVVPALIEAAKRGGPTQEDYLIRCTARISLTGLYQKSDLVVPFFIGLLTNKDLGDREMGARFLGDFGLYAKPAIPALRTALGDGDPKVQRAAGKALKRIESASN